MLETLGLSPLDSNHETHAYCDALKTKGPTQINRESGDEPSESQLETKMKDFGFFFFTFFALIFHSIIKWELGIGEVKRVRGFTNSFLLSVERDWEEREKPEMEMRERILHLETIVSES